MNRLKLARELYAASFVLLCTTRIVRALNDQADHIARRVVGRLAQQRLEMSKDRGAMDGIADEVFRELESKIAIDDVGGPLTIWPEQLRDAFRTVASGVLAP